MAQKAPLSFRAVGQGPQDRGSGPLKIQFSLDGQRWAGSMNGLDAEEVRATFTRLKARGAVIIDTEAYKHAA